MEVRRMAGLVTPASRDRSPNGRGDEEGEGLGDVSCFEEEGGAGVCVCELYYPPYQQIARRSGARYYYTGLSST